MEDEFIVGRVTRVVHDVTKRPPVGVLHFIGRDGRNISGSGHRVIEFPDIFRIKGSLGGEVARPTLNELKEEEKIEKRTTYREKRLARRKAR